MVLEVSIMLTGPIFSGPILRQNIMVEVCVGVELLFFKNYYVHYIYI
jgi:hypothetical protein